MYLKILPFNKTLFKKEFKMVKILVFIMIAILFIQTTLFVVSSYNSYIDFKEHSMGYDEEELIEDYRYSINSKLNGFTKQMSLFIFMPIGLLAILFGEEKRRKTLEVLATMPYTRYEIFFNKIITALVAIILPIIINGLIMILALGLNPNLRIFYSVNLVTKWILSSIYYQLPILSLSALFGTIAGTTISQIVLTGIFLVFPIGFSILIGYNLAFWGILQPRIDGVLRSIIENYSILGLLQSRHTKDYIYILLLSIIMIIISKKLFDKTKLERSGQTLEFQSTEGFFKVGVSICTALLMSIIMMWIIGGTIYEFNITKSLIIIIGYILGGLLGYIVAHFSIKMNKSKV